MLLQISTLCANVHFNLLHTLQTAKRLSRKFVVSTPSLLSLPLQELITLEEQEGAVHFKIGVLYARAGQQSDNEMFSNRT